MPPFGAMSVAETRQAFDGMAVLGGPPEPIAGVENRTVPGPGGDIPVRVYAPASRKPLPVLVYFHGGGWVIGTLETHDAPCRLIAKQAPAIVVSVDYRLAPEHKFPAAAEDCYAATRWAAENAASLGGDPWKIAVGGDSAGGNLAAVVSLMARDRGAAFIGLQLLVYPVTNWSYDTESYRENADGYLLTRDAMVWFWNHYLRDESDGANPYASPLRAASLAGLPPAQIVTAEFDPLRDEGEAYAARLGAAGVKVTARRYDGMIHGFFTLCAVFEQSRMAIAEAATALRAL